ncbi:AraC family transcriptional regulator [Paenibacillus sp. CAA11]|uniref:AraC family transcriptional regulator n=1 Tax=Paenibacillus sp. CAA11 TaxID=1532905 RepID=UPI000D33CAA1|nr:AraC family transcriptional regulator [Paenibacillus sp. CAA11]AWB45655.1 AraC family transcriptional regulator [Paenibacillus sp. CAA11]
MTAEASYISAANPGGASREELRVLFAGDSQTMPDHMLGPKIYDFFLFHYIENGAGVFRTEEAVFHLQAGSGFLIHPNQLVSYASDHEQPWKYRWMAFTGGNAASLVQRAGFSLSLPIMHGNVHSGIPQALASILQLFREQREGAHLASLGYLYLILAEAEGSRTENMAPLTGETRGDRIVKQMIHYMSSQYAYPISIEEMCSGLGYNRAYLSRIFKKETGISPVSYLLKLRIDKARHLLRERPDLSIEQVANSVGIPDSLYFSRQFRRFHGEAPSRYRQSAAGLKSRSVMK